MGMNGQLHDEAAFFLDTEIIVKFKNGLMHSFGYREQKFLHHAGDQIPDLQPANTQILVESF
jgi:hypothetical protein